MEKLQPGDMARPILQPAAEVQVLKVTQDGYICSHVKGPFLTEVHAYYPEELMPVNDSTDRPMEHEPDPLPYQ